MSKIRAWTAIIGTVRSPLTFYYLSVVKRSVKAATFHFSTICLTYLLITAISSSLFLSGPLLSTIYGQRFDRDPVLTVPDDFVVRATNEEGAEVSYTVTAEDDIDGTATLNEENDLIQGDNIEGNITISCIPPSGSIFLIGNTILECTATDAAGNIAGPVAFTVEVNPQLPDQLTAEISLSTTEGDAPLTVLFEAIVTGGTQPYIYSWDFEGDGTEDSNESSFSNTLEEAGSYYVALTVTDSNGLTAFDDIVINVKEEGGEPTTAVFTVDITSSSTEGVVPATFEFEANVTGGIEPYTYNWNFGDGPEGSNEQTLEHTFEEAGTYHVTLAVTDTDNQNESDSIEITVKEPPSPIEWIIILLVVLASIVIGGIALSKYKMNQRSRRRIEIPPSAIVEIRAQGGIDQ